MNRLLGGMPLQRVSLVLLAALTGLVVTASPAWAVMLSDFVVFGQGDLQLGAWFMVTNPALVGSNHNVHFGNGPMVFGVQGGGDLTMGGKGTIDGDVIFNGDAHIGKEGVVHGDVDAGDDILVGEKATIEGDATAGDQVILEKSNSKVLGAITELDTPDVFTPILLPPATLFSAGGPDIVKGNSKTTTLAPDIYGHVDLGGNNTLNLSSGTYFFDSLKAGNDLDLNLDLAGGPIRVLVVGDVHFGGHLHVDVLGGGTPGQVYVETHGSWFTGNNATWFGTLYAPDDDVHFGGHAHFTGALYSGGEIHVRGESMFTYAPLVPEPASVWLMGTGLVSLLGFRRRRATKWFAAKEDMSHA